MVAQDTAEEEDFEQSKQVREESFYDSSRNKQMIREQADTMYQRGADEAAH